MILTDKNDTERTMKKSLFKKRKTVILFAIIAMFYWGCAFTFIKLGMKEYAISNDDTAGKMLFAGIRFFLAGIITLIITYKRETNIKIKSLKDFSWLFLFGFGNTDKANLTGAEFLDGYTNVFTPFSGVPYTDTTFRDCTDTIARHLGKMKLKHVRRTSDGMVQGSISINHILGTRPNPFMTASEFLEKVVAQYFNYNNAFIYVKRDVNGVIEGLYPLDFGSVEVKVDMLNSNLLMAKV